MTEQLGIGEEAADPAFWEVQENVTHSPAIVLPSPGTQAVQTPTIPLVLP